MATFVPKELVPLTTLIPGPPIDFTIYQAVGVDAIVRCCHYCADTSTSGNSQARIYRDSPATNSSYLISSFEAAVFFGRGVSKTDNVWVVVPDGQFLAARCMAQNAAFYLGISGYERPV